uniref:Reverse transcriptase domain-containing protein n=2 Tax=Panagrellus redivivus TaxID=6233 RepID=A0A7E5A100_PANRE
TLRYLAYADDIAIPATSMADLTTAMESLAMEAKKIGLEINYRKTKWMRQHRDPPNDERLMIEETEVEQVNEFVYLGQLLSWPRDFKKEITRRIKAMRANYVQYRSFLSAPKTEMYLKRKLVNMVLLPTALYGCETWALTKTAEMQLRRGQRRLERWLLRVRLIQKIPSRTIRRKTKLKDWVEAARCRKWKFAKKISALPEDRWARRLTYWTPKKKRPLGRPRTRWNDSFDLFLGRKTDCKRIDYRTVIDNSDLWNEYQRHYVQEDRDSD